jgi:hypothetical protein
VSLHQPVPGTRDPVSQLSTNRRACAGPSNRIATIRLPPLSCTSEWVVQPGDEVGRRPVVVEDLFTGQRVVHRRGSRHAGGNEGKGVRQIRHTASRVVRASIRSGSTPGANQRSNNRMARPAARAGATTSSNVRPCRGTAQGCPASLLVPLLGPGLHTGRASPPSFPVEAWQGSSRGRSRNHSPCENRPA